MSATSQDHEFCVAIQRKRSERLYPPGQVIYALIDPRTDSIRYVGGTHQPAKRLAEHVGKGSGENRHLRRWIEELREAGLQPTMHILEQVTDDEFVLEREYRWILKLVRDGANLANSEASGPKWVERVKRSRCRDFLTAPRTSTLLTAVGFTLVRRAGDKWRHEPVPLSQAIYWCLTLCPDELPAHLEDAARRLGYLK